MKNQRMKHRASSPLLATLLVALSACGGSTRGPGGGNAGGGDPGGSGGAGGAGGGSIGPACEVRARKVYGCVLSQGLPPESTMPVTLMTTGTVTAVRAPDPDEPCSALDGPGHTIGSGNPEVMIDLVEANGSTLTVGLTIPGLTSTSVAVGDPLDIDFANQHVEWGGQIAHVRVERGGALVAAVGSSDPIGLTLGEGQSECYMETDFMCGYEEFEMTVEAPDGSSVSIPNGATAEIGELSVTNDRYFYNYDVSGACNFGLAVEYLVGAAPMP
ncbi:MAG TPA: hypothetical protein VFF45_00030 [Bacilli bacterium]|nr:hypothetical protein [Bacilli bacterium]